MSEKGLFDAAIAVLKTELDCSPEEEDEAYNFIHSLTYAQYDEGVRAGLRVLEAAGKVKDPRATKLAFLTIIDEARIDEENQFVCDIRALLEALPERGKEKK